MLPRRHRLPRNADFKRILARGEKASTDALLVSHSDYDFFRAGISISTKTAGAVLRNKIRRQLTTYLHELLKAEKLANKEIVILIKKDFLTTPISVSLVMLTDILQKEGVIK